MPDMSVRLCSCRLGSAFQSEFLRLGLPFQTLCLTPLLEDSEEGLQRRPGAGL